KGTDPFYYQYEGMVSNRSKRTLAQVTAADGTSNTLFFGESVGQYHPSFGPGYFDISWFGSAPIGTVYGILQGGPNCRTLRFSSYHTGVAQFAMGDGSVQRLRYGDTTTVGSADWYSFQRMGGFRDAQIYDLNLWAGQ